MEENIEKKLENELNFFVLESALQPFYEAKFALRKRSCGYHTIATAFVRIDWLDRVGTYEGRVKCGNDEYKFIQEITLERPFPNSVIRNIGKLIGYRLDGIETEKLMSELKTDSNGHVLNEYGMSESERWPFVLYDFSTYLYGKEKGEDFVFKIRDRYVWEEGIEEIRPFNIENPELVYNLKGKNYKAGEKNKEKFQALSFAYMHAFPIGRLHSFSVYDFRIFKNKKQISSNKIVKELTKDLFDYAEKNGGFEKLLKSCKLRVMTEEARKRKGITRIEDAIGITTQSNIYITLGFLKDSLPEEDYNKILSIKRIKRVVEAQKKAKKQAYIA
jgi:hypothetical protein